MLAAVDGSLSFTDPKSGKRYSLGTHLATLKVPPRVLPREGVAVIKTCENV